jgi:hypothetical protein
MSTPELREPVLEEKSRSGAKDRTSSEAPFSDLINRWLDEGDRISEVARAGAVGQRHHKERPLLELLRELRAKADRHRFAVVFVAVTLSAVAVASMRAVSHAVLKTTATVAAERPSPPAPLAAPSPPPQPVVAALPAVAPAAPPAPTDEPTPAGDPPAPKPVGATTAIVPASAPTAAAATVAASAPAAAATPAVAGTTPAAAPRAATAATATATVTATTATSAPAADPPLSPAAAVAPPPAAKLEKPSPSVGTAATEVGTAAPEVGAAAPEVGAAAPEQAPTVARHVPGKKPAAVLTSERSPLEACQSAIRWERVRDALTSCQRLTEENPKSVDAMVLMAHADLLAGRDAETLRLANRASALDPSYADAYLLIGNVHQAAGQAAQARVAYEAYLRAAPRGAHAAEVRAVLKTL